MGRIFVQIASYRDPELANTLEDLVLKATHPKNLTVCIAWQYCAEDLWHEADLKAFDDYRSVYGSNRLKVIKIPYKESKGVCWARNKIQQKYRKEKYTLQLDSHMRFTEGWDSVLIKMLTDLQRKGFKKPLITTYASSFNPENDPGEREMVPWKMDFDRFSPEGILHTLPSTIDEYLERTQPVPARFYSAHFAFTLGQFCQEVPHDPLLYFHGEEPSIAVRAFTHGYDLFHPHRVVVWHEYTRDGKIKQWEDDGEWTERDKKSHERFRELLGVGSTEKKEIETYGLGRDRPLEMWELYAGIRFKDKGVQQYTLDCSYPPNPPIRDLQEYNNSFLYKFRHYIDIYRNDVPEEDYDFWVIAFEKADGTPIHRADADEEEIRQWMSKSDSEFIPVLREYFGEPPEQIVVWPHSKSKGWCERLVYPVHVF